MIQDILAKMIAYDMGDVPRIQHFVKVYSFAHLLGAKEGMTGKALEILDIAAILHDIGIHPAEEKYGNCNGNHQEELGPDEARKLLAEYNIDEEIVERVCFLIGHHHTYNMVDGLDYQIILEADFLVNSFEENMPIDEIKTVRERVFKTKTGIDTLNVMYGLSD